MATTTEVAEERIAVGCDGGRGTRGWGARRSFVLVRPRGVHVETRGTAARARSIADLRVLCCEKRGLAAVANECEKNAVMTRIGGRFHRHSRPS